MKIANKPRIVGALMLLADKKPGRSSRNGPGISVWNWDINWNPSRYVPLSLPLPFLQRKITLLLPPVMHPQKWPCRSSKLASAGATRVLQPDGSLRCPAGQALHATEERHEADGSLRLVYAARLSHCRTCQLRQQCQWRGTTQKPRRVSVLLHPLQVGSGPLLWHDWSRRQHRRACRELLRHQRVDVHIEPPDHPVAASSPPILSRAQRAHSRLSWQERFARNQATSTTRRCTITLFGVPERFAASLGLLAA